MISSNIYTYIYYLMCIKFNIYSTYMIIYIYIVIYVIWLHFIFFCDQLYLFLEITAIQ